MTRIAEAQEWADQMAAYVAASKAALVGAEVAYQEAYQAEGAIGDPVTEVNLTLAYATLTAAREHLAENLKIRDRADMELDHALDHGDPPASKEDAKEDAREAAERLLTVKRDLLAEADGAASKARAERDEAIRAAVQTGTLTMYRLAQILGISQQAVRKIVNTELSAPAQALVELFGGNLPTAPGSDSGRGRALWVESLATLGEMLAEQEWDLDDPDVRYRHGAAIQRAEADPDGYWAQPWPVGVPYPGNSWGADMTIEQWARREGDKLLAAGLIPVALGDAHGHRLPAERVAELRAQWRDSK